MAKIKGMTAKLIEWMASILAALKDADGELVFKEAERYEHQLESGLESFTSHAPFAFVSTFPADPGREGDYDLKDILQFAVLIGVESKKPGIAFYGDDNNLGASRIRDLVIKTLEDKHPGEGYACGELEFFGETEMADTPKRYATELHYRCNWIPLET